jgi:hypothetical protein
MHETGDGLNEREWRGAKREILVSQPRRRDRLVAAGQGIDRAKQADEQRGQFEELVALGQRVCDGTHTPNRSLR